MKKYLKFFSVLLVLGCASPAMATSFSLSFQIPGGEGKSINVNPLNNEYNIHEQGTGIVYLLEKANDLELRFSLSSSNYRYSYDCLSSDFQSLADAHLDISGAPNVSTSGSFLTLDKSSSSDKYAWGEQYFSKQLDFGLTGLKNVDFDINGYISNISRTASQGIHSWFFITSNSSAYPEWINITSDGALTSSSTNFQLNASSSNTAVPEPASILLLAGGLVAIKSKFRSDVK
ncbi:MAG: PEP-CTERM sorting domain-containing protein [bacterium]|nr:PEP-CTERM sorting domain-containing protein [bacterium]